MSDEYKYKWTQCTNGRTGEKKQREHNTHFRLTIEST